MRKLVLVLVMLLAVSCSKDEDYECECIESVYSVELNAYDYEDFKLILIEKYKVDCTDEISYRDYISDNLIVIECN